MRNTTEFYDSAYGFMNDNPSPDGRRISILEGDPLQSFQPNEACYVVTGPTGIPRVRECQFNSISGMFNSEEHQGRPYNALLSGDSYSISVKIQDEPEKWRRQYYRISPGNFPLFKNRTDALNRAKFLLGYAIEKGENKGQELAIALQDVNSQL